MAFIEFRQRLYPLKDGENLLGAGAQSNIRIPEMQGGELAISVESVGAFVWAKGGGRITLNGHPLTSEPVPLFHGDQLALNGATLVFVDDSGTPTVPLKPAAARRKAAKRPAEEPAAKPKPERKIVLVLRRLEDDQAFVIDHSGFRIGREKRCDLIVPDRSVSRLHAEITFNRGRYLLRDLGRTPTKVNGHKIRGPHVLQVGDIIEVGSYEFAFARRPASAEDIVKPDEVTPIRGSVPEAPTLVATPGGSGGSRVLFWLIVLVSAGLAAAMLLT